MYFERCQDDAAIAKLQNDEFEIYVLMNSFASKKDASTIVTKLISWINSNSLNLFVTPVNW